MSPNPVTAAAAWTVALTVDVVAAVVAVAVLVWDHSCPDGVALCPAAAQLAGRDAAVLGVLAVVLGVVGLVALLRGRLLLALVQLGLVVLLAVAARAWLPDAYASLRHDLHLAGATSGTGEFGANSARAGIGERGAPRQN